MLSRDGVAGANLDSKRSLPGGRAHDFGRNNLSHKLRLAQPVQTCRRQNDRIVFTTFQLAQTSVHIPAQRVDVKIGPHSLQLRLAAQAAGTDTSCSRQIFNTRVFVRAKYVARILPGGHGRNLKTLGKLGGKVFQTMYCKVDASLGQGLFDLLGEHALGANLGEGNIGDLVAGGLDDFQFDFVTPFAQQGADVMGLPECELGASRADAETSHQARPTVPPPDCAAFWSFSFSWRLNKRRTMSTTVVASESRAALFRVVMGVCMILFTMPCVRVSMASSCSGDNTPIRPRTRSISACRIV